MPTASRRWGFWIAVAILAGIVTLWQRGWTLPVSSEHAIAAAAIVPEKGHAFIAPIPLVDEERTLVLVRECRAEKVAPVGFLETLLPDSRVGYYLNGVLALRFPALAQRWRCADLGPGEQLHEEIRRQGSGRYSAWKGSLYFSTSDLSDPRTNARSYQVLTHPRVPVPLRPWLGALGILIAAGLAFSLVSRVPFLKEHRPGFAIALAMLVLIYAGAEAWLRYRIAFTEVVWEGRHDPVAGSIFKPNAEIRHTNHAEYWVAQRSNSLGFLDREPQVPKPAGRFRILILGDSFVEAVQVPIDKKVQVVLERELKRALPGRDIDVVAMGYSGIGQSGELSFYEAFGKRLQPDLVIALAVNNDFANNSAVLEAIRYGWHPRHPPVMFYDTDLSTGEARRVEVDLDFQKHLVHRATDDLIGDFAVRTTILRGDPAISPLLAGWQPPARGQSFLHVEALFCTDSQLPIVRQADANTRRAFRELADLGKRDGFKVLVVASENVTTSCEEMSHPRDGLLRRLRAATDAAGLELFDLYPAFSASGGTWRFRLDRHWNETGHARAAEAIAEHLRREPKWLKGP